jgi:hypothetical protein
MNAQTSTSKPDLAGALQLLAEQGLVAAPRQMSVREFCQVSGVSESEVRHHPERFEHLQTKLPVRKVVFNAARVLQGIRLGDLRNRN